jgi:hypothetical protein
MFKKYTIFFFMDKALRIGKKYVGSVPHSPLFRRTPTNITTRMRRIARKGVLTEFWEKFSCRFLRGLSSPVG